jgi:uncharacterized protein with GYD domain
LPVILSKSGRNIEQVTFTHLPLPQDSRLTAASTFQRSSSSAIVVDAQAELNREVFMVRLITRGRFTQEYAKGLVAAPEDREPVVQKLVETVGGKLLNFYFTTGESDFLLIAEADEPEALIAALLATAAAGTISDVTTARAWTGKEFKAVAEKASKAAKAYKPPGKR